MSFQYGGQFQGRGAGSGVGGAPDGDIRRMDPYKVLGVSRNATKEDIKKAYKKKALKHHPDRIRGDANAKAAANAKFAEISHAYELLTRDQPAAEASHAQQQPFMNVGMNMGMDMGLGFGAGQGFGLDPFGAFGIGGIPNLFGFGVGGGFPTFNFPGFQFSDPFDLFRSTFGDLQGFDSVLHDSNNVAGNNNIFATMMGASSAAMSHNLPLNGSGSFTSYSYSSSTGIGGGMQTINTTTTIDGKTVTRTELTTIGPDGKQQTMVDLTGDDDDAKNREPAHLLEQEAESCRDSRLSSQKPSEHGTKRKFGETTRCLKCCFPSIRKRRRIDRSYI